MIDSLPFADVILAAAGGAGAVARNTVGELAPSKARSSTWVVNVAGSLLLGAVAAVLAQGGAGVALVLLAAFCGGFTTFSSFALQVLELIRAGRPLHGLMLIVAHVVPCMAAALSGWHWAN